MKNTRTVLCSQEYRGTSRIREHPPPLLDHHRALGRALPQGPRWWCFLISEVSLYAVRRVMGAVFVLFAHPAIAYLARLCLRTALEPAWNTIWLVLLIVLLGTVALHQKARCLKRSRDMMHNEFL